MFLNWANIHLILNHWPIFLPILSVVFILLGEVFHWKQIRNLGLALVVCGSLFTLPVYFTGSSAREIIQNYPEVDAQVIDLHRDLALDASLMMVLLALVCGAILYQDFRQQKIQRNWIFLVVVLLVAASGFMGYTAHVGGFIRHEELVRGKF